MKANLELINKVAIKMILWIILAALFVILIYSLVEFCVILTKTISNHPVSITTIDKSSTFLAVVLPLLSGILVLVIVIEMIESIVNFIKFDRSSYIYVITEIALIALIRHLITLDLHHIETMQAIAIGLLTFVVTAFYIALRTLKKKEI
jgi:uncharacterized membrane protein (DUF373 family)